ARRLRRCAWSIWTCCRRQHPFTVCGIESAPTAPAPLARDLAGHNGTAGICCRVRHKYGSGASAREACRAVAERACSLTLRPQGLFLLPLNKKAVPRSFVFSRRGARLTARCILFPLAGTSHSRSINMRAILRLHARSAPAVVLVTLFFVPADLVAQSHVVSPA